MDFFIFWDHEKMSGQLVFTQRSFLPGIAARPCQSRADSVTIGNVRPFLAARLPSVAATTKRVEVGRRPAPTRITVVSAALPGATYRRARKNRTPLTALVMNGLVAPATSVHGPVTVGADCKVPV